MSPEHQYTRLIHACIPYAQHSGQPTDTQAAAYTASLCKRSLHCSSADSTCWWRVVEVWCCGVWSVAVHTLCQRCVCRGITGKSGCRTVSVIRGVTPSLDVAPGAMNRARSDAARTSWRRARRRRGGSGALSRAHACEDSYILHYGILYKALLKLYALRVRFAIYILNVLSAAQHKFCIGGAAPMRIRRPWVSFVLSGTIVECMRQWCRPATMCASTQFCDKLRPNK